MKLDLRAEMESLRQIAPKLNAASDEAGLVMKEVEAFLAGLHLGVATEGDVFNTREYIEDIDERYDSRDPRRIVLSTLAYGRFSSRGEFCIHVAHETMDADRTESFGVKREAWGNCSRGDRLKAFATLPSLLTQIAAEAALAVDQAERAAKTVRESMGDVPAEHAPSRPIKRSAKTA